MSMIQHLFEGAESSAEADVAPGKEAVAAMQGDAEDFTWSVEFSLDGGTAWTAYEDAAGDSVFTGSGGKVLTLVAPLAKLTVVSMGTATEVNGFFKG